MNKKICDFCGMDILPTIENYRTFITLDLIEKGRRKKKVGDMCLKCYEKLNSQDGK